MADECSVYAYVPFLEEGEGFKEDAVLASILVAEIVRPKLLQALEKIPCDGKTLLTICDYGTGDGTCSMPNIRELIGILRAKYGKDLPIQIVHEDQPYNDYKSLVRKIHGIGSSNKSSLLDETDNLYVAICPTGFHSQCLPPNSVDLGYSQEAMHYMNKLPCKITGAIHSAELTVPDEVSIWKEHAANEWEKLLLARAKELKQGGRFILESIGLDDDKFPGDFDCKQCVMRNLTRLWKQMMAEGLITKEEFYNTNFLQYLRTMDEYTYPLKNVASEVYKAGLRLVSSDMFYMRTTYRQRWMDQGKQGDDVAMRDHAQMFVKSFRYWTNWVFMSALSPGRPISERKRLAGILYQRFEDDVARAPQDFDYNVPSVILEFEKV